MLGGEAEAIAERLQESYVQGDDEASVLRHAASASAGPTAPRGHRPGGGGARPQRRPASLPALAQAPSPPCSAEVSPGGCTPGCSRRRRRRARPRPPRPPRERVAAAARRAEGRRRPHRRHAERVNLGEGRLHLVGQEDLPGGHEIGGRGPRGGLDVDVASGRGRPGLRHAAGSRCPRSRAGRRRGPGVEAVGHPGQRHHAQPLHRRRSYAGAGDLPGSLSHQPYRGEATENGDGGPPPP